jgi:hypothetical protein
VVAPVILVKLYVILNIEEKYIYIVLSIFRVVLEDLVIMDYQETKVRMINFFGKDKNL